MTPKKELLETYKQMAKDSDFPSIKYASFMRRLSRMIRQYGINGEKERLIELSNLIDKKIA